ncbi:hypothetical protein J2W42_005323 [Rhizobium tibeticum]|nr:hypothetical protein [Rhizobium tibeticum]
MKGQVPLAEALERCIRIEQYERPVTVMFTLNSRYDRR